MVMQIMEGGVPANLNNSQGDLARVYNILTYSANNPNAGIPLKVALKEAHSLLVNTKGMQSNHVDNIYRERLSDLIGEINPIQIMSIAEP